MAPALQRLSVGFADSPAKGKSMRHKNYQEPGEKAERLLRGWGLVLLGGILALYGAFGLVTGKILAQNDGGWTLLEREDARFYAGLMLLVGAVLAILGWRER